MIGWLFGSKLRDYTFSMWPWWAIGLLGALLGVLAAVVAAPRPKTFRGSKRLPPLADFADEAALDEEAEREFLAELPDAGLGGGVVPGWAPSSPSPGLPSSMEELPLTETTTPRSPEGRPAIAGAYSESPSRPGPPAADTQVCVAPASPPHTPLPAGPPGEPPVDSSLPDEPSTPRPKSESSEQESISSFDEDEADHIVSLLAEGAFDPDVHPCTVPRSVLFDAACRAMRELREAMGRRRAERTIMEVMMRMEDLASKFDGFKCYALRQLAEGHEFPTRAAYDAHVALRVEYTRPRLAAAAIPMPPPTYASALHVLTTLAHPVYEPDLLDEIFGTNPAELASSLRAFGVAPPYVDAILEGLPARLAEYGRFRDQKLLRYFCFLSEAPPPEVTANPSTGRRKRAYHRSDGSAIAQFASTKPLKRTLDDLMDANMTAADARDQQYTTLVLAIVEDARELFAEVDLQPFPHASPTASHEEVARMYGSCITRKLKGGKLRVEGCRQSWRKLVRLLEYGSRYNRFDLDLVLSYAQASKTKGRVLSVALRWGAVAFGIPELEAIGNEPTLLHHVPGKILGAATTPAREQNKAPWISDDIVRFVTDLCHDPDDLVKARALFIYLHAICGLRDQDVQHITDIRIMNMAIVVIASYWKSSADKEVCECSTMPLLDPKGRSLEPAVRAMQKYKGRTYLLPDPLAIREKGLKTANRLPLQRCSLPHAIEMLQEVVRLYTTPGTSPLPPEADLYAIRKMFSRCTMHSFKNWLNGVSGEAKLDQEDRDLLLHWHAQAIQYRYQRNYDGNELAVRMLIVRLLGSVYRNEDGTADWDDKVFKPWRSRGPGCVAHRPPAGWLDSLPLVRNEDQFVSPELGGRFRPPTDDQGNTFSF